MEKKNVKKGSGRPKIFTEEEQRRKKTLLMQNKEWYCNICKTGKNYTLAGKWCHIKTKKHQNNCELLELIKFATKDAIDHSGKIIIKDRNKYKIGITLVE